MKSNFRRKFGRIFVSNDMVMSGYIWRIFKHLKFIPLKAEQDPCRYGFLYIGLSYKFPEVPIGTMAPEFRVNIKEKKIEMEWVK